jgi:hypothetical protein
MRYLQRAYMQYKHNNEIQSITYVFFIFDNLGWISMTFDIVGQH